MIRIRSPWLPPSLVVTAVALNMINSLAPAAGQDTSPPRVLLTADVIDDIRAQVAEPALQPAWAAYVARVPRHDVTDWHFAQHEDLVDAAFIATIDPSNKSVRLARCLLELACMQDHWCQPGNEDRPISLYAAATAASVALAYDWLYDQLDPRERRIAEGALERLAFRPFLLAAEAKAAPFGDYTNNWCPLINASVGTAASVMRDRSETASEVLRLAKAEVVAVLDGFGEDGGWAEGVGYWGAVVEHILLLGHVLEDVGTPSAAVQQHPALAEAVEFVLAIRLGDGTFINFGDCSTRGPSRTGLWRLASLLKDGRAQWLGEQGRKVGRWLDLVWHDDGIAPTPPRHDPATRLIGGIGWAVLRSGWDEDGVVLALSSGLRTGHSHLDANGILVHGYGETLLCDWGARGYPEGYFSAGGKERFYWSDTRGHNAILMDGDGQVSELGRGGRITRSVAGPHCDYVESDATEAYASKAERVVRQVVFVRPDYFLVIDDLEASWEARWEWRGQFTGDLAWDDRGATIAMSGASLRVEILEPTRLAGRSGAHDEESGYVAIAQDAAVVARFVTLLYPWGEGGRPAAEMICPARIDRLDDTPSGVRVTRADGTVDSLTWGDADGARGSRPVSVVSQDGSGSILGYSLFGGSALHYEGKALLRTSHPVWASAKIEDGAVDLSIVLDKEQAASLWCPAEPVSVSVDGADHQFTWNGDLSVATVDSPTGTHLWRCRPAGTDTPAILGHAAPR